MSSKRLLTLQCFMKLLQCLGLNPKNSFVALFPSTISLSLSLLSTFLFSSCSHVRCSRFTPPAKHDGVRNKSRAWINYSVDALDLVVLWISTSEVMLRASGEATFSLLYKSELNGTVSPDADHDVGGGKQGLGEIHESASLLQEVWYEKLFRNNSLFIRQWFFHWAVTFTPF